MSYQPISNPPAYSDNLDSHPQPTGGVFGGDSAEDDFKYDTVVSGCELSIRQGFIRKVYTLLFAQLLLTTTIGALINANDKVKEFALTNIWLFFVSVVGSFGFLIAAYLQSRRYPVNLILLGGFTLFEGYTIGVATCLYDTQIVLEAFAITLIVFIGLTLFAFQSKYDFTSWVGVLNTVLFALIGIGFVFIFFTPSSTAELIYSSIGAIIFSGYILVDTQLVLRKFNIEEEVPAAINLYLDIINLFLNILRILASQRDD
jgi:FtsH-binding integral membrane protein